MISVVSFPLLLDRNVGPAVAMLTSVRAVRPNPGTMALWGLIVAALLSSARIPFFIGLAVVDAGPWPLHLAGSNSMPTEMKNNTANASCSGR